MKQRRRGGMVELLPTPTEKKDGLIRDHVLELMDLLDRRIRRIEGAFYISEEDARAFRALMEKIRAEEKGRAG